MASLSQTELEEAVREWCEKRWIPVDGKNPIVFFTHHISGSQHTEPNSENGGYRFYVQVREIAMPVKDGPYR